MTRRGRPLGVVLGLVLLVLVSGAAPAQAHAGGLTPQNFRSTVTGIVPPLAGVSARMVNNGTELELRNGTGAELTVQGDPLRTVQPGGVLRYRDDRAVAPPAGRTWRIPVRSAGVEAVVVGTIEWREGPSLAAWLLITTSFAVLGLILGRSRWWRPGLAAGVVLVTCASVVHAVGAALAVTGQPFVPLLIGASGVGLVCWPLSAVAVVTAVRRAPATAFVAAVVGAMLVVAGIPDFDSFRFSALPFAGSADVDRLLVAITLGGGAGLAAGGFAAARRALPEPDDSPRLEGTPA